MKVSRTWLQKYFEAELPSVEDIADALTFHAFEIEEIEGDMMDVKILPDRAAYALSHRGIASELSAILHIPLKKDPLREELPTWPKTEALTIQIETDKSIRQMGALVRGVKVGPSPAWLKEALESVGQRSVNNVVDATNYVTLDIGQPLHAFDAHKIEQHDGVLAIRIRESRKGEKIKVLTGEEYSLPEGAVVIAESISGVPLDIAGIKGGMASAITESTTDLYVSVANFDGTSIRKTAQFLKLWTDASLRFQNRPSPELAAYGMREVLALIQEMAGGEVEGVVDVYAAPAKPAPVHTTLANINNLLGSSYSLTDVTEVFDRLGFTYTTEGERFTVTAPFERRDIVIPEDIAEEVGRIHGYDGILPEPLPALESVPDQALYRGRERIKDVLLGRGFVELSTQTFAPTGATTLANPLDQTRPALRTTLVENMREALQRGTNVAPRVLGPVKELRLFELGTTFEESGERISLVLGIQFFEKKNSMVLAEIIDALHDECGIAAKEFTLHDTIAEVSLDDDQLRALGVSYVPAAISLGAYHSFSIYPFALRDVAVWTPTGTEESEVATIITREAGELLARIDLFDRFTKEVEDVERTSYAFRLVFESFERTLSDEDLNPLMEKITTALNANDGWEVR